MATIALVKESIVALKDRSGSSVIAINKWIEAERKVSQPILSEPVRRGLTIRIFIPAPLNGQV
jgi:hypothetical protein